MGLIFSAFGWSYAWLQIPGGWFIDKIKPRIIYALLLASWSLVTAGQGLARGFAALFGFRFGIGVFETPSFPINNMMITAWFPEQERARAVSIMISGMYVGLAFLTPVLVFLQEAFGWRSMFIITGLLGVVWAGVYYYFYRDPADSPKANRAELDYIWHGGGLADRGRPAQNRNPKLTWNQLKTLLSNRNLVGYLIGHTCVTCGMWFFLTWFPTYLVKYRHMDFIKMGFWAAVPFIAAFVGVLCSGQISDWLLRKGLNAAAARKYPICIGLVCAMAIVGANYVQDHRMVMFFMTLAFLGNGLSSISWSFVAALAPAGRVGFLSGVHNFMGNLPAIFVPLIIGFLVRGGRFEPALIFIGACALVGMLSYLFVVKSLKRIELPDA
jgi:ACS family D-galactonate transporter-like MFS transporter